MFVLQRLLLLPLLSPLLAVLLVAAINPRPGVSVRLLTWSSPAWPLGGWLAAAAGIGAVMSAGGTALALQGQAAATAPRRQVRRRSDEHGRDETSRDESNRDWDQPRGVQPPPPSGPTRGAGEPAPTVSVPFRVIRKGSRSSNSPAAAATQTAVSTEDNTDWAAPLSEDW